MTDLTSRVLLLLLGFVLFFGRVCDPVVFVLNLLVVLVVLVLVLGPLLAVDRVVLFLLLIAWSSCC
jgi:hypothetical protein